MDAFAALLWNPEDQAATDDARHLLTDVPAGPGRSEDRLTGEGFALIDLGGPNAPARIIPLRHASGGTVGAVFGTLFRKQAFPSGERPVAELDAAETGAILSSEGRALIGAYWGSYIAIFRGRTGVSVLTDPTASIPCYFLRQGSCLAVFSHLEKCSFLDRARLSLNLPYVATLLTYDRIQTQATGLREVGELAGGKRLTLSGKELTTDRLWDPRRIACDRLELPLAEAARQLLEMSDYVIGSRASSHSRILVSLSGGLDSALVLASLAETAPAKTSAVHITLGSGDAPEVGYARAAARHAGCDLIEVTAAAGAGFPAGTLHPPSVRPHRQFLSPGLGDYLPAAMKETPGALFTGQGGDHLFRVARNALGFTDHVLTRGLTSATPRELLAAARLSGRSVWSVLAETAAAAAGRPPPTDMAAKLDVYRTRITERFHGYIDPGQILPDWASEPAGLPPGKFDQLASFVHMFQARLHLDTGTALQTIHPLISQPLIELCLRLPAWLLSSGGISRGLIRQAASGRLPEPVRLRQSKGSASRFFLDRVAAHRETMLVDLREGALIEERLITQSDLDGFMAQDGYRSRKAGSRLLLYYGVDSWLRSWRNLQASGGSGP